MTLEQDALNVLKTVFYDRLQSIVRENTNSSKSTFEKNPSIIIILLKMTRNNRVRILNEASTVPSTSKDVLEYLRKQNYIRPTMAFSKYTLTAQGIWEIENALKYVSLEKLLEYIDSGMESVVKKLSDKEKVILFTLLSLRAFSQSTPLTRITDIQKEKSAEIMIKCADFLHNMGVISTTSEQIFKGGNISDSEEPGSKLLRRKEIKLFSRRHQKLFPDGRHSVKLVEPESRIAAQFPPSGFLQPIPGEPCTVRIHSNKPLQLLFRK